MEKCLQHDVWMLVATCSPQARNTFATNSHIDRNMYTMSGEEGGGRNMEKVFATWEKVFATWKKCSQHGKRCLYLQHASQHHDPTTDMFPDSNRVARKVSDASSRIGRPGASNSVTRLIKGITLPTSKIKWVIYFPSYPPQIAWVWIWVWTLNTPLHA
jgi:hypothetical protein